MADFSSYIGTDCNSPDLAVSMIRVAAGDPPLDCERKMFFVAIDDNGIVLGVLCPDESLEKFKLDDEKLLTWLESVKAHRFVLLHYQRKDNAVPSKGSQRIYNELVNAFPKHYGIQPYGKKRPIFADQIVITTTNYCSYKVSELLRKRMKDRLDQKRGEEQNDQQKDDIAKMIIDTIEKFNDKKEDGNDDKDWAVKKDQLN